MVGHPSQIQSQTKRGLAITLLVINLCTMLLPQVYLTMARGNLPLAFAYFCGSSAILIASMFLLYFNERTSRRPT